MHACMVYHEESINLLILALKLFVKLYLKSEIGDLSFLLATYTCCENFITRFPLERFKKKLKYIKFTKIKICGQSFKKGP
jgi:hypothetical protein